MTFSKNGVALAVLGLEFILSSLGFEFDPGSVSKAVEATVVLTSFLFMVWNQLQREEVKAFFFKKV